MSNDAKKVNTLPQEELGSTLEETIKDLTPEEVDGITQDTSFREATAKLLSGQLTVPEWEWFVTRSISRSVDLPFIEEAMEREFFSTTIDFLGSALQGFLTGGSGNLDEVTNDDDFRQSMAALLHGTVTVPEFIDVVSDVIDGLVNIPWVPAAGEDLLFDKGLEFLANSLHGLLVNGSENA